MNGKRTVDSERRRHREMLGLCLFAITLSFLLLNGGDGKVHLPADLNGLAPGGLPPACPSDAIFGFRCPGCGMTRAFIATSRLDLAGALAFNWGGPLLFLLAVLQVPYRLYLLRSKAPGRWAVSPWLRIPGYLTIALMIAGWAFEVLVRRGGSG